MLSLTKQWQIYSKSLLPNVRKSLKSNKQAFQSCRCFLQFPLCQNEKDRELFATPACWNWNWNCTIPNVLQQHFRYLKGKTLLTDEANKNWEIASFHGVDLNDVFEKGKYLLRLRPIRCWKLRKDRSHWSEKGESYDVSKRINKAYINNSERAVIQIVSLP